MNAAFRRVRRSLLRLAARAAKERWDQARLDREVQDVLADSALFAGDSASGPETLSAEAAARYARLTTRTASAEAQRGAAEVLRTSGREFSRAGGRLRQRLVDDVAHVLRGNGSVADVEAVVRRRTRQAEHAVQAIAQTATGGFDRAATLAHAEAAGTAAVPTRYRFTGPAADRDFCRARLAEAAAGETFTLEQIRAMDNGQGLPPELYCGGYNCRHRWTAVVLRAPSPAPSPAPSASGPPAPPPNPALPGFSGIYPDADIDVDADALAEASSALGRPVTAHELVSLTGAPDGSRFKARRLGSGGRGVNIEITHPWFSDYSRQVRSDSTGLHVYNAYLMTRKSASPPAALGAQTLYTQARAAEALGVHRLHTQAAGSFGNPTFNGYYTWPRYGYDAELSSFDRRTMSTHAPVQAKAEGWPQDVVRRINTSGRLRELFAFPEGREMWRRFGGSIEADFDTDPSSYSMTTLRAYLADRGLLP